LLSYLLIIKLYLAKIVKVSYEYIPSPDAEERINRAYNMLFDPFDPSASLRTQGPFGLSSGSKTILSEIEVLIKF